MVPITVATLDPVLVAVPSNVPAAPLYEIAETKTFVEPAIVTDTVFEPVDGFASTHKDAL